MKQFIPLGSLGHVKDHSHTARDLQSGSHMQRSRELLA